MQPKCLQWQFGAQPPNLIPTNTSGYTVNAIAIDILWLYLHSYLTSGYIMWGEQSEVTHQLYLVEASGASSISTEMYLIKQEPHTVPLNPT